MEMEEDTSKAGEGSSGSEMSLRNENCVQKLIRERIKAYYTQLKEGCGLTTCRNPHCASSPEFKHRDQDNNVLAAQAYQLCKNKALLCDRTHRKRTHESMLETPVSPPAHQQQSSDKLEAQYFTEDILTDLVSVCQMSNDWSQLIRAVGKIFGDIDALLKSFNKPKEEIRAMDIDHDKDNDDAADTSSLFSSLGESSQPSSSHTHCQTEAVTIFDVPSLRRCITMLFNIDGEPFVDALCTALIRLCDDLCYQFSILKLYEKNYHSISLLLLILELPTLQHPSLEKALVPFFKATAVLPIEGRASLCRILADSCQDHIKDWVNQLQQIITVEVMTVEWSPHMQPNDNQKITGATRVMKLLYYVNMLCSVKDSEQLITKEKTLEKDMSDTVQQIIQSTGSGEAKERSPTSEEPLEPLLRIRALDVRDPIIPYDDFINESLSGVILMSQDYPNYHEYLTGSRDDKFSFLINPFILTPALKSQGLYYNNQVRMVRERRHSIIQSLMQGGGGSPYLKITINRNTVVTDAMLALELVAADQPSDLKKQLYVEFEGEQGIDEGGVSKEFFQLVVEQIFNPDYGMFTFDEETRTFWFNPTSFDENDGEFTLIGIMLGLAIYNNVILDVRFPMVVYRKLLHKVGTFEDLADSHSMLYRSLKSMLAYEGDVEEAFMQTFQISHKDVFGATLTHQLKENGDKIPVTNENREEFVELYSNYLLNTSIARQFKAFHKGFLMVSDESPISYLFRPEEVELLVCGSKNFDFQALEESAEYEGGFTAQSTTVVDFWAVVHELDEGQKRQLLAFTTGSDRVPIGGLAKLKLIIVKNGPDSERLPTSHTCFNVILLPDYANRDKLRDRLILAITHSKGFGML